MTSFSSPQSSPVPAEHRIEALRWLEREPDDDVRDELRSLLTGPDGVLAERFSGMLVFGTAGLRAEVGAGPLRMNRLVVRQAAAGFADYLLAAVPDAATRGVLVGWDARRKSDVFAADTARVFAARGVRVVLMPSATPTPVLAWNVTRLGVAGAVMVTASHNPATDNGFKVFTAAGSQIVPPVDADIAARMAVLDPCSIELADEGSPLIESCGEDAVAAYLAWLASVRLDPSVPPLRVAYSALCGVAGATLCRAFAEVGFPLPTVVASQQDPDGSFPGLPFPNPEEHGVMDEVVALAAREGLPLALANDPDGDRLGVAIPTRPGGWRRLSGDEIGWLLAEYLLERTSGPDRMVATTVVSSTLLERIAERHGVVFEETFTGFKWLADRALQRPDLRLVFAYEQALGFLVASRPLDKDGISAAIVLVEVASVAARDGLTIEDLLDRIADRYGKVFTFEQSVPMAMAAAADLVTRLSASPPTQLGAFTLERVEDVPAAGLVRLFFRGVAGGCAARLRMSVRPSGTEPKVKFYGEMTVPPRVDDPPGGSTGVQVASATSGVHPGGEPDAALLEGLVRWFVSSSSEAREGCGDA